jgi:hydrogenase maturation protease
MFELVVIGYGNSLRQDDGFGPAVVERLLRRVDNPKVELLAPTTLTPELAATLASTLSVIFIDACATLGPGELEQRRISADPDADVSLVHFLSPEALLTWTERLYGQTPQAELWLVGSEETGLSESLTPRVAARVEEVVRSIEQRIHQCCSR